MRLATNGRYCGVHARKASLHDLFDECFVSTWEWKVKEWHRAQQRQREDEQRRRERKLVSMRANSRSRAAPHRGGRLQAGEALELAKGLGNLAQRSGFDELASHIRENEFEWALAFFR